MTFQYLPTITMRCMTHVVCSTHVYCWYMQSILQWQWLCQHDTLADASSAPQHSVYIFFIFNIHRAASHATADVALASSQSPELCLCTRLTPPPFGSEPKHAQTNALSTSTSPAPPANPCAWRRRAILGIRPTRCRLRRTRCLIALHRAQAQEHARALVLFRPADNYLCLCGLYGACAQLHCD